MLFLVFFIYLTKEIEIKYIGQYNREFSSIEFTLTDAEKDDKTTEDLSQVNWMYYSSLTLQTRYPNVDSKWLH